MADAKLPATKPYRVAIVGAMYTTPVLRTEFDGSQTIAMVTQAASFGEEIELTEQEAHRLTELGAIKPKSAPLSYDEMNDKQLDAAVKETGVTVVSSGADQDKPLRSDKINALLTFDQGRGVAPA